ncbi:MAG: DUF4476 domain-containing protein [Leptospiraceae bacterium]|nr:DUF4476 domain-containing protein [Leptospiraceae bacterium]
MKATAKKVLIFFTLIQLPLFAMSPKSFVNFMNNFENQLIDENKIRTLRNNYSLTYTCDQARQVLSSFLLGNYRVRGLEILASKIEDPDNKDIIMTAFNNDILTHQTDARQILNGINGNKKHEAKNDNFQKENRVEDEDDNTNIQSIIKKLKVSGFNELSAYELYEKYGIIDIAGKKLTQKDIELISKLRNLKGIIATGIDFSQISLKFLLKHPSIIALDLGGSKIRKSDSEIIGSLSSLKILSLDGVKNLDNSLFFLKNLKNLEYLDLTNNKITDESLKNLSTLVQLKEIDLSYTSISGSGFDYFSKENKITKLWLNDLQIDDDNTLHFHSNFRNLEDISIKGNKKITIMGIRRILLRRNWKINISFDGNSNINKSEYEGLKQEYNFTTENRSNCCESVVWDILPDGIIPIVKKKR